MKISCILNGGRGIAQNCHPRFARAAATTSFALLLMSNPSLPAAAASEPLENARRVIARHETEIRPLEIAGNRAWWNANISGRDEDFKAKEEAQNRLDAAMSDPERYAQLKQAREALRQAGQPADPQITRQIELLHLAYLEKQLDPSLLKRMTAIANKIEQTFNVYRVRVDDREMSDSAVREALKTSTNSAYLKKVWEGSKAVGSAVEPDLKELVRLRNESARKLGFATYHEMRLQLSEQTQAGVIKLFDELEQLAREPFAKLKLELDEKLARRLGLATTELRPWHYQDPFFQESPALEPADFDAVYAGVDIAALCRQFYAGIGLPVDAILARSDLYEKKGKCPHAFCSDIDGEGEVRILVNIVTNEYWMGTTLHELGHAVYAPVNIPLSLPCVLRTDAHPLCTEGMAMMFEKFSKNADWLQQMGVKVPDPRAFSEAGERLHRNHLLIFAAWSQVMFRFEKALYENPQQDLNRLWWDLVEKYQGVRRPEGRNAPDFAAKIHIVSAPAYYHNYIMGQLFASQLHHTIAKEVLKTEPAKAVYVGQPKVGEFLREKVFAKGRLLDWNALAKHATGSELNARAFAIDLQPR